MSATERINEVWASQRRRGLLRLSVFVEERAAGEETDRLGHGGLEEAAKLRVRGSVRR